LLKPANILLIFSDQHRFDALGAMGNPIVQTPNLDRLAREGVFVSNVWCQSPVCQPSTASVITGSYPHQLGLTRNGQRDFDRDWPNTMKQLQAANYETATFGKTHYLSPSRFRSAATAPGNQGPAAVFDTDETNPLIAAFGWDHVAEEYDRYLHLARGLSTPYMRYLDDAGLLAAYQSQIRGVYRLTPAHWRAEQSVLDPDHDLTSFIARAAMDWIDARTDQRPFFAKVAFVAPHVPLIDDPIWAAAYADADIKLPDQTPPQATKEIWSSYLDFLRQHSQVETMDDDFIRSGIRHYYGIVSLVDQKIGELIEILPRNGLSENTWILYAADHGAMLGQHYLWAKHNFYQPSVKVPLVIRPPTNGEGLHNDELVELIDLSATLTDIAGASPVPGSAARSLLPVFRGGSVNRDYQHSMIGMASTDHLFAAIWNRNFRLTTEVTTGTHCELFDLRNDPGELHNLVAEPGHGAIIDELNDVQQRHIHLNTGRQIH
jgi:choline-sulfatase